MTRPKIRTVDDEQPPPGEATPPDLHLADQPIEHSAEAVWQRCAPADGRHAYILAKSGKPDGLRVVPAEDPLRIAGRGLAGWLVLPLRRLEDHTLFSLQFISPTGEKLNLPGRMGDGAFVLGDIDDDPGAIWITEGISQAWACCAAAEPCPTVAVVAAGWSRARTVAKAAQARWPGQDICLVGDVGTEPQAEAIAHELGIRFACLPDGFPANYDANDYARDHGLEELRDVLLAARLPAGPAKPKADGSGNPAAPLPETVANRERVAAALGHIDPDIHRAAWLSVLMGVHWLGWECGQDLAQRWSERGEKYKPGDVSKRWPKFSRDREPCITIDSVFAMAREGGWEDALDVDYLAARERAASRRQEADWWEKFRRSKASDGDDDDDDDDDADADDPFADWPSGDIGAYLFTDPPPIPWFADERLLMGRGHAWAGIGGSSKTRVLYHLAIAAVTGRLPWGWTINSTGSAALFLTEDTADEVHRMVHHIVRSGSSVGSVELKLLTERLRVFPLAGRHALLLAQQPRGALQQTAVVDWLMRKLEELPQPVVFVGLDPAIAMSDGDEASATHQRRLGELVDRIAILTGACAVLTTHSAKSSQAAEELGSHASRGSGALTDAMRAEYMTRTMTAAEARTFGIHDLEERKRHVQLVATKGNSLPPAAFVPLWLRRDGHGMLQPAELEPVSGSLHGTVSISAKDQKALEILRELTDEGKRAAKASIWTEACAASGVLDAGASPETQRKQMARIRQKLAHFGLVVEGDVRGEWRPASPDDE